MERRKTGQEVQKLRRWQQDQELKHLKEDRRKEKAEEAAAREQVLRQIAEDRWSLQCEISGFLWGVDEVFRFLGCYAVYVGSYWPLFQDSLSFPSSRIR